MNARFLGNSLVAELLADPAKFKRDGRAYQLLEECFSGLPVENLRPLLRHPDILVRHAALWVASELGTTAWPLLDDAAELIASEDRFESYHALEITAVCAVGTHVNRFSKMAIGLESKDDVICILSMRLIARADAAQIAAAASVTMEEANSSDSHRRGWKLLAMGETVDVEEVKKALTSELRLERYFAAVAAMRLSARVPSLLAFAARSSDSCVCRFASGSA